MTEKGKELGACPAFISSLTYITDLAHNSGQKTLVLPSPTREIQFPLGGCSLHQSYYPRADPLAWEGSLWSRMTSIFWPVLDISRPLLLQTRKVGHIHQMTASREGRALVLPQLAVCPSARNSTLEKEDLGLASRGQLYLQGWL